jgi:hypothetical protein
MRIPQNGRISSSDMNKFVDSTIADLQNTVNQVNVNESSTLDVLNTAIREISNLKKRVAQLEDEESFDRAIRAAQNLRIKAFKSMTDLTGITFPGTNQSTKPRINTLFNQATVPINAVENKFYTNSIISGSIVPISQSIQIDVTSVIGLVDYESGYVKLSQGNPENAFNGDNQSYWQRKVEFDLDSDVEEVQVELTVRIPDQANTEANALYIRPYPVSQVDVFDLGISADLSSGFSAPGNSYPIFPTTALPLDNARDSRFFFSTQSVQRIKIRLRQRNWYEENGRKVFSYGLQELGLQLSEFDKTYSATASLGDNHTFITKFTCPPNKKFKGLHLFETTPDYTKDADNMRFKIASDLPGNNILWDSSINSSPQSLVQPIDLGTVDNIYVITTLNYIETASVSSNFFAGTTPVLDSIGLQYSVS